MNSEDFKQTVLRREKNLTKLNVSRAGLYTVLSAAAEMTTIVDTLKKSIVYDKALDIGDFKQKVGALSFTLANILENANSMGTPTENKPDASYVQPNLRIMHGVIGMFGEAGELVSAVLKEMRGDGLDLVNVGEETADSDWYKMVIHDETGTTEEGARAKNDAKLTVRFGDSFSESAALNRDLAAERAALEGVVA